MTDPMATVRLLTHVLESKRARRCSRFLRPDDSLSRAMSDLVRIARCLDDASDEIDGFHAPRECMGIVVRHCRRDIYTVLAGLGLAPRELEALVLERVTMNHRMYCLLSAALNLVS